MLTKATKNTINLAVPSVVAGIAAYYMLKLKKDWRVMLVVCAIAWLLTYIVTARLTKAAYETQPAQLPSGGGCDSYDPTALIDAIHEDINCTWCTRNRQLYDTLIGLSDCQMIKAYNYWNSKYYTEKKESLPVAIMEESAFWDGFFGQQQLSLKQKFATLNLQ